MGEAFLRCKNVEHVEVLPGSFTDVMNLKSASEIILNDVTYIRSSVFYNYANMRKAIFPKCSYICGDAFMYCNNLSHVELANVELGANAFEYCTNIEKLVFRGKYAKFNYYPFSYNTRTSMNVFMLTSTIPTMRYGSISTAFSSAMVKNVYVPESLYDDYINDPNWSYISDRIYKYEEGML